MKTIEELEKQIEKQQSQIESLLDLTIKLYEVNSNLMERRTTQEVSEKIDALEKQAEEIKRVVNVNAHATNVMRKTIIVLTAINPNVKEIMTLTKILNV